MMYLYLDYLIFCLYSTVCMFEGNNLVNCFIINLHVLYDSEKEVKEPHI